MLLLLRSSPAHTVLFRVHHRSLTTLGIRREDPSRIWERRAPLTPNAVSQLVESSNQGENRIEVESCNRRCFPDGDYAKAGASIVPTLSDSVDVVLGIKEPQLSAVKNLIGRERIWMMFSHTHKGQHWNTPLLATLAAGKQSLIDHELLTAPNDEGKQKRVAGFGWFAGVVGAGEALSMTGLALLRRGIASPLLHLPRPYTFSSLDEFRRTLREMGQRIGMNTAEEASRHAPLVIGVTGAGNVAEGAKSMLNELGVEWVEPERLPHLGTGNGIYACAIPPASYFQRIDGGAYNRQDYYDHPDMYRSVFVEKIAPYLTTLINGAGWQTGFPRLMTTQDLLKVPPGIGKLIAIQDVSCDLKGGLEFVDRHTTIDRPFFETQGVMISSIDILPTELPVDASRHFSEKILPYVRSFLEPALERDMAQTDIGQTLKRGMILDKGKLMAGHECLLPRVDDWLKSSDASHSMASPPEYNSMIPQRALGRKRVLLLGSGLVAGPAVEVFVARGDINLVIASNNPTEARNLVKDRNGIEILTLDVNDYDALSRAVSGSDVVVSLLPAPMHPKVAEHCVKHGKHMVTASYNSPEMMAFDQRAREKDVVFLGECGLDPGIDSMAAMRILDRVRREGRKVSSFISWCGGLPEPSASNIPLGYKFSWSPKGVLSAALNEARYKLDDKTYHIRGNDLLSNHFPRVPIWKGLALEGLANRDSLPYAAKYGMGKEEELRDIFRGTLRYQGFSRLMDQFRKIGFLSSEQLKSKPHDWNDYLRLCIESSSSAKGLNLQSGDERSVLTDILGSDAVETEDVLRWLSILPDTRRPMTHSYVPIPPSQTPIDLFASLLSHKLAYAPNERDSVLLHHTFKLRPASSSSSSSASSLCEEETVTASLNITGSSEHSAMALTVGSTLAFASCRVLDGSITSRGVRGPYDREVWQGVLNDLQSVGVDIREDWN